MDPDVTFNDARAGLLETMAEEMGESLLTMVREYNRNPEFKRRIDVAALSMSGPTNNTIH
jgi:hypothetical protein